VGGPKGGGSNSKGSPLTASWKEKSNSGRGKGKKKIKKKEDSPRELQLECNERSDPWIHTLLLEGKIPKGITQEKKRGGPESKKREMIQSQWRRVMKTPVFTERRQGGVGA